MKPHFQDGIKYYTLDSFDWLGIQHGFFTRSGGVSAPPWDTLNTAQTVGDTRENVIENRRRIFNALGRNVESIFDVWQVHSDIVLSTDAPRQLDQPHQKADGILTDRSEITLMMRFADCVPIMLFDTKNGAAGIVHAGWKGTLTRIAANAVEKMAAIYNTRPEDIIAGIGPSIGPDHYEVGDDVALYAKSVFNGFHDQVLRYESGKPHLDLWRANAITLGLCGVRNIEVAGFCTACNTGEWFSHRGDQGRSGRFAALLVAGNAQSEL